MDNDFILFDRIEKIKQIINQYGEDNFYISFSGGKDSMVLHYLIDLAFPSNKIPRVYSNTGIEYVEMLKFVEDLQKDDDRIIIIKPKIPIKQMLERDGYPFKSKAHSRYVMKYQKGGNSYKSVRAYTLQENTLKGTPIFRPCPKKLLYQFSDKNNLKISDKCCDRLKEEPLTEWAKLNNKKYHINGIMRDEGGRRSRANCLAFQGKNLNGFHPLVPVTKDWEDWFISEYNIKLCKLYYPPYNFNRTGCKGCPFALHIQDELDTLEKFFPNERKQCEIIWKPVYDEYRRLGYRLNNDDNHLQMSLFDIDDSCLLEGTV